MLNFSAEKIKLIEEENEQKNNQGKCMFIGIICENATVEIIQSKPHFNIININNLSIFTMQGQSNNFKKVSATNTVHTIKHQHSFA